MNAIAEIQHQQLNVNIEATRLLEPTQIDGLGSTQGTTDQQAVIEKRPEAIRTKLNEQVGVENIEPLLQQSGLEHSSEGIQAALAEIDSPETVNPTTLLPDRSEVVPTSFSNSTALSIESNPIQPQMKPAETSANQALQGDAPTVPLPATGEMAFQALPPLGRLQSLGMLPELISPHLESPQQETLRQVNLSSTVLKGSKSGASDISLKSVDSKATPPFKPTAPVNSLDSWSGITDLLEQSSVQRIESRSWQDVVSSLTDSAEIPTERRSAQAPDALNCSTDVNEVHPLSESLLSPQYLQEAPLETITSTLSQTGFNASSIDPDAQLERLAWTVYHQLRQRFAIESERQGRGSFSYPLWTETIALHSPQGFQFSKQLTPNPSTSTSVIEMLSPTHTRLIPLTDAIYDQLRSRLALDQERQGLRSHHV